MNFYSRLHLRFPGKQRWVGDFNYIDRGDSGMTDNGWEIVPDHLRHMLHEANVLGLPILVTENGIADVTDVKRGQFLRDHTAAINQAADEGVPVHGFFYWSLVDNYEWLDGFGPRFGLFRVDLPDLQRHPRPSVEVFRSLGKDFLQET